MALWRTYGSARGCLAPKTFYLALSYGLFLGYAYISQK